LTVAGVFFLNGAVFGSWYGRVPAIQDDLGLGTGALGIALLGAPIGLLAAQPVVGALTTRHGSRRIVAAAPIFCATVVLPALAVDAATLFAALLVVGATNGALDIAMNAQGFAVERAAGRRLFNSLHAAFSFGALAGALGAAFAAGSGIDPLEHLAIVAVVGALAAVALVPGLFDDPGSPHAARIARPTRRLAALAAIAFCALLAEGAVFDWSAVQSRRAPGRGSLLQPDRCSPPAGLGSPSPRRQWDGRSPGSRSWDSGSRPCSPSRCAQRVSTATRRLRAWRPSLPWATPAFSPARR
jgi:MFS family permease